MENGCSLCLTQRRRLSSLGFERLAYVRLVLGEAVDGSATLKMCWECRALVDKSLLFCKRVRRAYTLLTSDVTALSDHDLSVTSLGSVTRNGYDYSFTSSLPPCDIASHDLDQDYKSCLVDPRNRMWEVTFCPIVGSEEEVQTDNKNDNLGSNQTILQSNDFFGTETEDKVAVKTEDLFVVEEKSLVVTEESNTRIKNDIVENKSAKFTLSNGYSIIMKDLTKKREPGYFSKRNRTVDPNVTIKTFRSGKVKEIKFTDLKKNLEEKRRKGKVSDNSSSDVATKLLRKEVGRGDKIRTEYMSETAMQVARNADKRREQYATRPFKCETCIVGFISAVFLEEHKQSKHNPTSGRYPCDICAVRFGTAAAAAGHRRSHYRLYTCTDCDFASRRHTAVARHRAAQHGPARDYKCTECSETFSTIPQRKYHRAKFHRQPHRCPHCAKTFSCLNIFKQHLTVHTVRPLYACAVCARACRGKAALAAHMRTHIAPTAEGAYCVPCGIQYKSKYIYRQHLKTSLKHVRKEDLRHGCDHCEQRFVTQRDLKRHADVVHHNNYVHKCDQCDKAFGDATNLKRHTLKVHQGVLPAKNKLCEVCNKAFLTNGSLARHQLIHTGERPHACDICGATFRQSATLYTHRRLVHLRMRRTDCGWEPRAAAGRGSSTPWPQRSPTPV